MRRSVICLLAIVSVAVFAAFSARADVFNMSSGQKSLQFVTVGDPGNTADLSGFGSVGYVYQIGKFDVTAAQYCQFLNAVAKTDDYGLYDPNMANPASSGRDLVGCGISQSGTSGTFTYTTTSNPNFPVNFVSWGDAARFCNWLQNGQPVGPEGVGTTETGAYTLNGDVSNLTTQTRNAGATYFLPSIDEWWKAAYYKGGSTNAGYWTYPTQSDTAPINTLPDTGNHANFYDIGGTGNHSYTDPVNYLTEVGAFSASPGPYGTFDMGGDVSQWNETVFTGFGQSYRGSDGGSFWSTRLALLERVAFLT